MMSTKTMSATASGLNVVGVDFLSDDELLLISGGGPILVGCLLAAGGAAVALTGLVVGVIVYAVVTAD